MIATRLDRAIEREVNGRLAQLGFPRDDYRAARQEWVRRGLREGWLERTAVSELLALGTALDDIAVELGMTELRVRHHLSRGPGMYTSPLNQWRLVYADDEESEPGSVAA